MTICSENGRLQLKQLSSFIARLNAIHQHHVGYCGEQEEEIYSTLQEEFGESGELNRWFTVMYHQDEMVGALGFNVDDEERAAELWGPFIDAEGAEWDRMAEQLWTAGIKKIKDSVDRYFGFYNIHNQSAIKFLEAKGGVRSGDHAILRMRNADFIPDGSLSLQNMTPAYTEEFKKLHAASFPNTYYSAEHIMQQLDENHRLFILTEQGRFTGYVYVEGDPEFKEGSIEYLAVSDQFQRKGYGRTLLGQALHYLFHNIQLEEISVCVELGNEGAIQLYRSTGFDTVHKLTALRVKSSGV
ncbi:GNAT family N-acetyltransferase [Paenibacillus glucanolyticus]|uniref:GCN5 family acetyltransferase n=2 Tax=Paenibacillus TaxID=44249 RepID=A0A163DUU6_9BACL|nr:GNAT family N-acetyltransferase [Paenibacillus glucanolyticus]KZS43443.1 GCN5 family acetyltransferase [Paenibacillus glucanolyticus]